MVERDCPYCIEAIESQKKYDIDNPDMPRHPDNFRKQGKLQYWASVPCYSKVDGNIIGWIHIYWCEVCKSWYYDNDKGYPTLLRTL